MMSRVKRVSFGVVLVAAGIVIEGVRIPSLTLRVTVNHAKKTSIPPVTDLGVTS